MLTDERPQVYDDGAGGAEPTADLQAENANWRDEFAELQRAWSRAWKAQEELVARGWRLMNYIDEGEVVP